MIKIYNDIEVEINKYDLNKSNVVYKFTFPNGKVYIGQTINKLRIRIKSHCYNACNKDRSDFYTLKCNAIKKYKSFKVEVLYQGDDLDIQEIYYINKFNSINKEYGYNLESGGVLNKHHSEETKKKISEANKGRVHSEESKKKISEANKGSKNPSAKPIIVTELSTGIETKFGCIKEAADYYNISRANISLVVSGKQKTFSKKQYIARYEEF